MNNEDLKFFKQLKEDMLNGNDCYQAHPRFWMIMDYEDRPVPEDYGGEYKIIWDGNYYTVDTLKTYLLTYKDDLDEEEQEDFEESLNNCDELDEIIDVIGNYDLYIDTDEWYEVYLKSTPFISRLTGAFLTKEDAEAYLKANHYHHSPKAHTYALTGIRNPRLEKLLDIILNNDWE